LTPAITGMNMTATAAGGQNNRYNILTALPTGNSFVGQPSVTYAWTNKTWPGTNTAQSWQQQLFLVSGASSSGAPNGNPGPYDAAVDWNLANVLWFTVQANADGTAYLQFRAKTNNPNGNGMFFNTETNFTINTNLWPVEPLAQVGATSPLGAFSITIANDTNLTITTPGGSTNIVLDPAWAALFADPMTLCLGDQPNAASGYGQTEVISGFGISGNTAPFSDDFTTDLQLNTNLWRVLSSDPNGVNLVPPGSAYWMTWTLPDSGFSPQTAGYIGGPASSWSDINGLTILNNGTHQVLIPSSALQGVNQNYFRLIKRTANGLQVLLPGETAAPGTLTGKTGTPTAADTVNAVTVTVNAVDTNTWHIVAGVTDTIQLATPTDGQSILPNAAAMVNGTGTYQLYFGTTGSQTVTATDTTNTNIPTATSSSVTVN
jgi:hypothetical protein